MSFPWLCTPKNFYPYRKLAHVAFIKSRIGWQNLRADEFIDEGPYCVTGTDIIDGKIDWARCYHVSQERYNMDENIKLQVGDLLVTKDGTIGKVAVIDYLPNLATLNSGLFVVRPKIQDLSTEFLRWVILSGVFESFVKYHYAGSTINHLYQNVFEKFRFPYPDLPTQKRIANFLDRETARIDQLIEKKKKLVALLEEKRQDLITTVVTKGLNPNVPMKDSGIPWMREVPTHWDIFALKRLVSLKSGESINAESIDDNGEYPVFGGNGLRGYTSSYTHEGTYVLIGRQGALCGNINYAHGKFWASEHAIVVSPVKQIVTTWLGELLRAMNLNQYSIAAAQPGLSIDNIANLNIPVPPLEEQSAIANFLEHETSRIDSACNKIIHSIDLLKEYRSSLITAAVTGQIDVDNWRKKENTERQLEAIEKKVSQ